MSEERRAERQAKRKGPSRLTTWMRVAHGRNVKMKRPSEWSKSRGNPDPLIRRNDARRMEVRESCFIQDLLCLSPWVNAAATATLKMQRDSTCCGAVHAHRRDD
jgi:hypothetical protein